EADVGHDRGHHRVVAEAAAGPEVEGGDGQDVVAVDQPAPLVHRYQAVGVAVEGQAGRRAEGHDLGPEGVGVGGTATGVDVRAVGVCAHVEAHDLGPQLAQDPGGGGGRRPVAGIDDDAQPVQPAPLQGGEEPALVFPQGLVVDPGRADGRPLDPGGGGRAGQEGVELRFEAGLDLVAQFPPAPGEELDAVV